MAISLEIDELDLILARKRAVREVGALREPEPPVSEQIQQRIAAISRDRSAFFYECLCGREVVTTAREGNCPNCGRGFDLTAFGS